MLKDDSQIYHCCRRMPSKHADLVMKELDMKLKSKIFTAASLLWFFSVVISTKKGKKHRFCVDYMILKQRIKSNQIPPSRGHVIFEELAGWNFFEIPAGLSQRATQSEDGIRV